MMGMRIRKICRQCGPSRCECIVRKVLAKLQLKASAKIRREVCLASRRKKGQQKAEKLIRRKVREESQGNIVVTHAVTQ